MSRERAHRPVSDPRSAGTAALRSSSLQLEHQADRIASALRRPSPLPPTRLRDGDPVPGSLRAYIEPQLGWNFEKVRLFPARETSGAEAATRGADVSFAPHHPSLHTPAGFRLLAHELVHVVQQGFAEPRSAVGAVALAPASDAPAVQLKERLDDREIRRRAAADARRGDDLSMLRRRVLHEHFASDEERRRYTQYFIAERFRFFTGTEIDPDVLDQQLVYYEELYQQDQARYRIEARAALERREAEELEQELGRLEAEERMQRMAIDVRRYPVLNFHAAVGSLLEPFVEAAEALIKFVPVAGEVVMGLEALLGQELFTGRKLSGLERGLDALFALLPFAGQIVHGGVQGARVIYEAAQQTGRSVRSLLRLVRGVEELSPEAVKLLEDGLRAGKLGERELEAAEEAARALGSARRARLTGARELAAGDYAGAEKAYEEIRAASDDVDAIANNTGIMKSRIQRIKDHLFYRLHQLDEGPALFDADPQIANAWRRLVKGTHTPADLQLLEHEVFEAKFEGIFKTDYRTAHQAANRSGRLSGLE